MEKDITCSEVGKAGLIQTRGEDTCKSTLGEHDTFFLKGLFEPSFILSKINRRIRSYLIYSSGENGAFSVLEQDKITSPM